MPHNPALFILPPESSPLVELGTPITNVNVSGWREPHALTRYVNFSLFRPTYARPLTPQAPAKSSSKAANGALAFAHERQGVRYLTLGFDPLALLGPGQFADVDLYAEFSRLVFRKQRQRQSQATGEPIPLGSIAPGDVVVTPTGQKIALTSGPELFRGTYSSRHLSVDPGP